MNGIKTIEHIITYINEDIRQRYILNENLLRQDYINQEQIDEVIDIYNTELYRLKQNIKKEINNHGLYKNNNDENTNSFLDVYLRHFANKYCLKKKINDNKINESILSFLNLILKVKCHEDYNLDYDLNVTIDKFIEYILFIEGYKSDIILLLDVYIEVNKYNQNYDKYIINFAKKDTIKYEISERNKKYTKIVNKSFFYIIESLQNTFLLLSSELLKTEKNKYLDFFNSFKFIKENLEKIDKKFNLFSKAIYSIKLIIKINEAFKNNHGNIEKNYERISNLLINQSTLLYNNDYINLYNNVLNIINIIEELFTEKNDDYINLLFYIYLQTYKNIYDQEIRIKLLENYFNNKYLLKKSVIFLNKTLCFLKPEIFNIKNTKNETKEDLIKRFMYLKDNKDIEKYHNLIDIYNNINSPEFNEVLLFFFEGLCQSYFLEILKNNENQYNENCCKELLLNISLDYLKKAMQYLYEYNKINNNNILKIYAIAYIKTYFYFYVEVNYNYYDKCNFEEINKVLNYQKENNELIRNMLNIYIWRLYSKKFENFEQFKNFNFSIKNIPFLKDLIEKINKKKENNKYIFKNAFITPSSDYKNYRKISLEIDKDKEDFVLNYDDINNNLDLFYSILVNNIISHIYGDNKNICVKKMKNIYDSSYTKINFGEEGKTLYKYLLNNALFENEIEKKISEKPLTQEEFEILLYSFRFIFNTQIKNKKCFYNEIIRKNSEEFIKNNYIPGSFPLINQYYASLINLENEFPKKLNIGYYICKDCGFLYEIRPCTLPVEAGVCPNGHAIGGINYSCSKRDVRIFYNKEDYNSFIKSYNTNQGIYSYDHITFEEFKNNYKEQFKLKTEKGIINTNEHLIFLEKNSIIRDLNIISFSLLNFILNSYIIGKYILYGQNKEENNDYISLKKVFSSIKKDWKILEISLKDKGIESVQTFINMTFAKIIEIIRNLNTVDTIDKLNTFEKEVDNYIIAILTNKENIDKMNKEYQTITNELINIDPQSFKEIILENYEPSIYDTKLYPDIQFYTTSNIYNFKNFINAFNSSKENQINYSLINILINKDENMSINLINMKYLININKLVNLLLNIYSNKITREEGKSKILKEELMYIISVYNKMIKKTIKNGQDFINNYINPFIESWNKIKNKSIQYKCRTLIDLENGEKPHDITLNSELCNFLVDDGDNKGGMFLASAYENFIEWQNEFISLIISKNKTNGIHSSYISSLEEEIDIQDAKEDEIININEKTYELLHNLILSSSMRNIFLEKNKIVYKNYNNIIYDFNYIEEELGKILLSKIKKFKNDKIRFMTYLYEGLRGNNSSILIDYNIKYPKKELLYEEINYLNELLLQNNNKYFINDSFSSLQTLMNVINQNNYEQNILIYNIIESLSKNIIINNEIFTLLKDKDQDKEGCNQILFNLLYGKKKLFTINSLVSIFEYFESICWDEMKKRIPLDYQLKLSDEIKNNIRNYFEINKNNHKLINKTDFCTALRKLVSRSIIGTSEKIDIKSDAKLKLYISREDLWNKPINLNNLFEKEIDQIFKDEILIGHCFDLYNSLV